jgi:hypothetical protein
MATYLTIPAGCSLLHPSKQSKVEKKQASESKKADKEYDKAKKQHLKLQKKETLKMMKKTKKRSTVVNKPKKRGFLGSKKCR